MEKNTNTRYIKQYIVHRNWKTIKTKSDIDDDCNFNGESFSPKKSSRIGIPWVVLPLYNTKRQQINIQNPQDEHIVDEPVDNEQEQVIE